MKQSFKRLASLALTLALVLSLVPAMSGEAAAKKPTKITLKATQKKVEIGKTVKVSVKSVTPKKADKAVTFKSSDKAIATVSSKGIVTGKKAGTVTITATSKKTKKVKAKIKIKVVAPKPTEITLKATSQIVNVGETVKVSVKSVTPGKASKAVSFKSSDETVATVSSKGVVTGKKAGKVTITATSDKAAKVKATIQITVVQPNKVTKVWVPIPQTDGNQVISDVKWEAPTATESYLSKIDSKGNQSLYIEWDEKVPDSNRIATITFHASRKKVTNVIEDSNVTVGDVDKAQYEPYLKKTAFSGSLTDGIVKETADRIVKEADAKTILEMAKAIFDWEVANLQRIESNVIGCGVGDVEQILKDVEAGKPAGGKCTDLNSVFVALCRAEGIPAREIFGIRMNAEDITKNQHCRSQFYLPKTGWVEADPADVLKAVLTDNLNKDDATVIEPIKEKYWLTNNAQWVMLSMDRDIVLDPKQNIAAGATNSQICHMVNPDGTLNNFGYPYAEIDGKSQVSSDASGFSYIYSFKADSVVPEDVQNGTVTCSVDLSNK